MLPILRKRQEASLVSQDEKIKREPDQEKEYDIMESAAEEIISAIHSKDAQALAACMRAAFQILESEPHLENEEMEGEE